jgi:TolA-binding protein
MRRLAFVALFVCACGPSALPAPTTVYVPSPPTQTQTQTLTQTQTQTLTQTQTRADTAAETTQRGDDVTPLAMTELRPRAIFGKPPRPRVLLAKELDDLQRVLERTSPDEHNRPAMLLRIGMDFIELETRAKLDGDPDTARTARSHAAKTFAQLEQEKPGYAENDAILFHLAQGYDLVGDRTSARETFLSLVKRHPTSRFVSDAYVSYADIVFDEATRDASKWPTAEAAYREAVIRPPPANRSHAYAAYKLGLVLTREGHVAEARAAFEQAIESAKTYFPNDDARALVAAADAARADITSP